MASTDRSAIQYLRYPQLTALLSSILTLIALTLCATVASSQDLEPVPFDEDDFAVSYSYAAVMGSLDIQRVIVAKEMLRKIQAM